MRFSIFSLDLCLLCPEILLSLAIIALMLFGVFSKSDNKDRFYFLSLEILLALTMLIVFLFDERGTTCLETIVIDELSQVIKLIVTLLSASIFYVTWKTKIRDEFAKFEHSLIALFIVLGLFIITSAQDLMTLFVGLELQSLAFYIFITLKKEAPLCVESGLKTFVMGALATGFFLFGCSFLYGVTGSTNYILIGKSLQAGTNVPLVAVLGTFILLTGMAFKLSLVPFHMWTPDVYDGTPTYLTLFIATVPQIAILVAMIRLLMIALPGLSFYWQGILFAFSLSSMILGAFAGLVQQNIKRLLAYSTIGGIGYTMLGVIAGTEQGIQAALFQSVLYALATMGIFVVLLCLKKSEGDRYSFSDIRGLIYKSPFLTFVLSFCVFSLAGIPPVTGFLGKLMLFKASLQQGWYILSVMAVLCSVVAAGYYLRIIRSVIIEKEEVPFGTIQLKLHFSHRFILLGIVAILMALMFYPDWLLSIFKSAARGMIL